MKKYYVILLIIMASGFYCKAQFSNDLSIHPLLNEGETKYKELVDRSKIIERFEIDVINQSENRNTPLRLISGKTYSIILLVEKERVSEFELKIYSAVDKTIVLKNETNNPSNILETTFQPEKTDNYEFEIIARKFIGVNNSGRYCLIIAS